MKKLLFISLLTILIFAKCTKENTNTNETAALKERAPDALVSMIKIWHENKMIHNETMPTSLEKLPAEKSQPTGRKVLLIPDYSKATYETLPTGAIITTIAADEYKFSNSKVGFFRTFSFLSAGDKIRNGKIVEFYGDTEYINKHRKYLISNYNKMSIPGFTGSIFTYDIYYRPLRNRGYKDGEMIKTLPGIVGGQQKQ